jgi:hypothetical protein
MLGNYTTLLLNGSQHNVLCIALPDKRLKYYPSLYRKNQFLSTKNVDTLYVKPRDVKKNSIYYLTDEEIKNDGTAKFRLKDNILFCNHSSILKLTRKNVNYIISNCEIDKSDIKTPIIILKSKSGWKVVTLDSEQAKYSMNNAKTTKNVKSKNIIVDYMNSNKNMYTLDSLSGFDVGSLKINFTADNKRLLDKMYQLQDFKCFTSNITYPIV